MDNLELSSLNYFQSNDLNRLTEIRGNANLLSEVLKDSNTFVIPVSQSKNLFSADENPKPVTLPANQFYELKNDLILLGKTNGSTLFALDITNSGKNLKDDLSKFGNFNELRRMAPLLELSDAAILSYAKAMTYWHAHHKFCEVCGGKTVSMDAGHKRMCTNPDCKSEHFPRTDPAIIVLVSKGEKCLLARQSRWRKGQYATIAGFVEPGETLEQAVIREVYEESGIHVDKVWYHSSQPWPFPGTIMIGFHASANSETITLRDHELEDAKWLSREQILTELSEGSLKLSPPISVSFRLIEDWFDENEKGRLRKIIADLKQKEK